MIKEELFPVLDEQASVGFTGRVNVLDQATKRMLGFIELLEGDVHNARFRGVSGLKAFYNLCVASFEDQNYFKYVVEPEIIQSNKLIHFPYSVLKRRVSEVVALYKENKNLKPPGELKLLVNPIFVEEGEDATGEEFDLLCAIADYNQVKDVYKNCELLDYQITNALVSLRKKRAITVIKKV